MRGPKNAHRTGKETLTMGWAVVKVTNFRDEENSEGFRGKAGNQPMIRRD